MKAQKPFMEPANARVQQTLTNARNQIQNKQQLQKAAEDFEALFVFYMLRSMRQTVVKSGLLGNGIGGEMWESMFDQELAGVVARNTPLGIAELLVQQLSQQPTTNESATQTTLPIRPGTPYRMPVKRRVTAPNGAFPSALQRLAPFESHIQQASQQFGVDANLIRAVILAESSGNPRAISSKGAKGLMQLMDATARAMGVRNPLNPEENILGGTRYLSQLLQRFDGDIELALAAYNAGPTAVQKHKGIPPYQETQQYVARVQAYLKWLSAVQLADL